MAELLQKWLNEEVGLSKKITNFEDDFASGYLFGELLYKFNQQTDFEQFSTKQDQLQQSNRVATSHFVMNFEKLEPTLRSLSVQFNSRTVEKIMSRERGLALRLLYQLKMVLEKVYPPADISIVAKTGTFGDNQPAQRIAFSKPKYDDVSHTFFKQRIGKLNRAQKDIDLELHQQHFVTEMKRQQEEAEILDRKSADNELTNNQEMRRIQINKLQRNAGFMEEWLSKGVEDWKQNMEVKKTRETNQLEFDFTQAEKYNKFAQTKLKEAQDEVHLGIADFEKNLLQKGIITKVTKEVSDLAIAQTLNGNPWQSNTISLGATGEPTFKKTFNEKNLTKKGNFTLTSTGLKHRAKKTVTDSQRNEREKRRRRLINQQSNLYVSLECQNREEHVTNLMKRQSRQEQELDYEAWRTTQCKNIIVENRKLREKQYEFRRQYDTEIGIEKEEKLILDMQNLTKREIEQMIYRTGELKVYEKENKIKQHTELCSQLMEVIFDIADEAYLHLQDIDLNEWDSRNWQNWLDLFVAEQKITGTFGELLSNEHESSKAHQLLDEKELTNYQSNKGQWPTTLISQNKINLVDIIAPKVEVAQVVGKGAKPVGKALAQAEVQFDEADLELTDKPANNFLLGDVLDQIVKLNYNQRPNLKHPPTPNWLALKICLVGYPFAGKKKQAALLKEQFGCDIFVMDELIQEAIEFKANRHFRNLPVPIQDEGSDFQSLSEDEIYEKDLTIEMLEISSLIKEQLLNGEEISDGLYIRLFVCKLRIKYEYKCPITKRKEIKSNANRYSQISRRINEIGNECINENLPKKEKKQLMQEKKDLEKEMSELDSLPVNGWVLVDFPCNYAQAKLLEEALSGYKPIEELEVTELEIQTKDYQQFVKPHPQPQPPKTLIPSGLDAVIWFDCPISECLHRSSGRRFDSHDLTQHYHVFDMKPPINQAPLCERLLQLSEDNESVQGLPDRFIAFDQNSASMKRWFQQFGDAEKGRTIFKTLSADQNVEIAFENIKEYLNLILQNRQMNYEQQRDEIIGKMIVIAVEEDKKDNSQRELSFELSQKKEDRVSPNTSAIQPKQPLNTNRSNPITSVFTEKSTHQIILPSIFSRDNIEKEFRPVLMQMWQDLSANYRSQMKKIFRNLSRIREKQFKTRAVTQQKFLKFLNRLDNKQELLDYFVQEFNKFSDEYPDLREDNHTKEELHQRCDVLSDELWEIVEERKEQNIDERKKIMESGQTESCLEFYTMSAMQLMQAELDKFKAQVQIIHDYYFAIEEKSTYEIVGETTCELVFDGDDMPLIETIPDGADNTNYKNYNYPRLDKILQSALKNQVVPDVNAVPVAKDAKGGAKAPPPKKGAAVKETETETQEESIFAKEMKEAVKIEKQILRYRLVQIRNWTLERLQGNRRKAIEMNKKFEDWIMVSYKTEMDTIEEMCKVVKRAIEEEIKIQVELRINFMDFIVDETMLNFVNPPIPKLEALEEIQKDRMTIVQLKCFYKELLQLSKTTGDLINNKEISNMLYAKIQNGKRFGGYSGVPSDWLSFGESQINQIIRNIDSKNSGYVQWKMLIIYVILLKSNVPSAKEISRIESLNANKQVTIQEFLNQYFWFSNSESSKDRPNAHQFQRVKLIKELLFQVFAENGLMNVNMFTTILGQISQRAVNEDQNFYDVLFRQVRI